MNSVASNMTLPSNLPTATIPNPVDDMKKLNETSSGNVSSGFPTYYLANNSVSTNTTLLGAPSTGTTASLYVGDLNPDVTESILFELFNQVGPVSSIRVCRDAVTRRSLGYAYVNFYNISDGERALDTLNYTKIKGQPCRIMWSQRDPALRRSGAGNIFIKNLDKSIDDKALYDTFSAFGNILSCKVVSDENGSKGFGFVHFETRESAEQAIQKVNNMLLNDQQVYVGHHIPKRERVSKLEEMKSRFTNVYVKNLKETITEEELSKLFQIFGSITSILVQKDEHGKSKGFGFINYNDHDSAAKAIQGMDQKDIDGNIITVCRAQTKSEREEELRKIYELTRQERIAKYQGVNLYVKNIDESIDEEQLKAEFSSFGEISSSKIMTDDKGASKGFGFVCFMSNENAAKALTEMNGKMLKGKPLYVAFAQRKDERRSILEAQFIARNQYQRLTYGMGGFPPMYYPNSSMYMNSSNRFSANHYSNANPNGPGGLMYSGRVPRYVQNASSMNNYRNNSSNNMMSGSLPTSSEPNSNLAMAANTNTTTNALSNAPMMLGGSNPAMLMSGPQIIQGTRNSRTYRPRSGFTNPNGGMMPSSNMVNGPAGMSRLSTNPSHSNPTANSLNHPIQNSMSNVSSLSSRRGGYYNSSSNFRTGVMSHGGGNATVRGNNFPPRGNEYYSNQQPAYYSGYPYGLSSYGHPNGSMMSSGNTFNNTDSPGLTAAALASAPPEVQKQLLGERLYPLVASREPDLASKITGMLLEMDNGELLHLLESPDILASKISEAIIVLQQHNSENSTNSNHSKDTNITA